MKRRWTRDEIASLPVVRASALLKVGTHQRSDNGQADQNQEHHTRYGDDPTEATEPRGHADGDDTERLS